jgi:hypothetical protein
MKLVKENEGTKTIKHVGVQRALIHPRKELAALALKRGMAKAVRWQL